MRANFVTQGRLAISAILLCFASVSWHSSTNAASMSDLWWNPNESGWGVNIVEQQGTLFVTLFVYGPDGRPTWYVGPATTQYQASSSSRSFSGPLYTTLGPWLGGVFNPNNVSAREVGTVTFIANSPVTGTLSYSVDGVPVTKFIRRQTWKHINMGGTYYGAIDPLSASTCFQGSPEYTVQTLVVTVNPSGDSGTINMTTTLANGSMSFTGNYVQYGSLYEVLGTLTIEGASAPASIRDFTADDDGIRGNLILSGSCSVNLRFSAVRPG